MKAKGKKFISLCLVVSLMMLSANLYAKERRGAKLIITKTHGYQIEGELITVKPNSLLLLNTEGKDVSVDIADIKIIKVVKKYKGTGGMFMGALGGALGGAGSGFCAWLGLYPVLGSSAYRGELMLYGALFGALFGAVFGAVSGFKFSRKFKIEGKSDKKIQETMDKLRKKARIRDYK
jgi:hypothetical protein